MADREIWVCADCNHYIANADLSSCGSDTRAKHVRESVDALGELTLSDYDDGDPDVERCCACGIETEVVACYFKKHSITYDVEVAIIRAMETPGKIHHLSYDARYLRDLAHVCDYECETLVGTLFGGHGNEGDEWRVLVYKDGYHGPKRIQDRTFSMAELEAAHEVLCSLERDHHEIKHCLCTVALAWGDASRR